MTLENNNEHHQAIDQQTTKPQDKQSTDNRTIDNQSNSKQSTDTKTNGCDDNM